MDYLRVAAATDEALLAKDMAFLRGLLDSANEAKNCVVVMVMIASENDTMQLSRRGSGSPRRAQWPAHSERTGRSRDRRR